MDKRTKGRIHGRTFENGIRSTLSKSLPKMVFSSYCHGAQNLIVGWWISLSELQFFDSTYLLCPMRSYFTDRHQLENNLQVLRQQTNLSSQWSNRIAVLDKTDLAETIAMRICWQLIILQVESIYVLQSYKTDGVEYDNG